MSQDTLKELHTKAVTQLAALPRESTLDNVSASVRGQLLLWLSKEGITPTDLLHAIKHVTEAALMITYDAAFQAGKEASKTHP